MTAVSDPARPISRPTAVRLLRRPSAPVWLAIGFTAAWTVLAICRTLRGDDFTYDTAIFTEAVKGWAHGSPFVPLKGMNLLGDHWSPILALLAPAWWVWPSPLMIVTAQAVLFGVSVWVVADTAVQILGKSRGLSLAIAYAASFGLQNAIAAGFHEIAFAVPLLALVGRQLLLQRPDRAAVWSLPLLLVKEDLGLTVAALGLLLAARYDRRLLGLLLAAVGLAATAAEVSVLIPAFNPHHAYAYWSELPAQSTGWQQITALASPSVKVQTLAWTFGVTGFLCLRSPIVLLTVPTLLWRFASNHASYWGITWHYSAVLMPVVFLAAADGWQRLVVSPRPELRAYVRQAPGIVLAVAAFATFTQPNSLTDLFNWGTYPHGPHTAALLAADKVVPPGVTVAADTAQLSLLAAKDTVTWAANSDPQVVFDPRPDYIVTDNTWWPLGANTVSTMDHLHPGATYRIVFQQDGVYVLKRVS